MVNVKWFVPVIILIFLVSLLGGCAGTGPAPTPTPTATPAVTGKPEILSATAGIRTLQSGSAIQPSTTVQFVGQGPADAQIRLYKGTMLVDTTTTGSSGQFTINWTAGTGEETVTLRFTAKKPDLPESVATEFVLVVDGTGPFIVSASASADALGGTPPVVTVVFSEPIVVSDMTLFTLVPSPYFSVTVFGGSFNPSQISLGADKKTVTLTGTALTDQLPAGAAAQVVFVWGGLLTVKDEAGNNCVLPATITFTVSP